MTDATACGAARAAPRPRVLVLGAGVAALELVLSLGELARDRAEVVLVAPDDTFTYRPAAVAETFGGGPSYRLGLDRIAARLGCSWHRALAIAVDTTEKVVVTSGEARLPYDLLVVACGARAHRALAGALTFRGARDEGLFRALLDELRTGAAESAAFAAPPGTGWLLPLYELALMTAADLARHGVTGRRLMLVTPERAPLAQFGDAAAAAVEALLETAGVEVHCGVYPERFVDGLLYLVPAQTLEAARVVTLPRLGGPHLQGLPATLNGFLRTDAHGRVAGVEDVFAAGDVTAFPIKQGGLAVQQAEAVAEAIAARLGGSGRPKPFRPFLRGLLVTGAAPRFLAAELEGGHGDTSTVAPEPLWWPPTKIAGGRLSRYLVSEGLPVPPPPAGPATVPVAVALPAGRPNALPVGRSALNG